MSKTYRVIIQELIPKSDKIWTQKYLWNGQAISQEEALEMAMAAHARNQIKD